MCHITWMFANNYPNPILSFEINFIVMLHFYHHFIYYIHFHCFIEVFIMKIVLSSALSFEGIILCRFNSSILQFELHSLWNWFQTNTLDLKWAENPSAIYESSTIFSVYCAILKKNTAALGILLTLKSGLLGALYLGSYESLKNVRLFSGITERSCACVRSKALTSFSGSGCSCNNNNNDKKACG